jgi:hypothetical protein
MMRKSLVLLAVAATLGIAAAQAPASAAFHGTGMHTFHGGNFGALGNRAFAGHRFAFHDRFAFRHHFFPFRHRFAFATVDGGCFAVRRVWSPWGWRWHRVWVCG